MTADGAASGVVAEGSGGKVPLREEDIVPKSVEALGGSDPLRVPRVEARLSGIRTIHDGRTIEAVLRGPDGATVILSARRFEGTVRTEVYRVTVSDPETIVPARSRLTLAAPSPDLAARFVVIPGEAIVAIDTAEARGPTDRTLRVHSWAADGEREGPRFAELPEGLVVLGSLSATRLGTAVLVCWSGRDARSSPGADGEAVDAFCGTLARDGTWVRGPEAVARSGGADGRRWLRPWAGGDGDDRALLLAWGGGVDGDRVFGRVLEVDGPWSTNRWVDLTGRPMLPVAWHSATPFVLSTAAGIAVMLPGSSDSIPRAAWIVGDGDVPAGLRQVPSWSPRFERPVLLDNGRAVILVYDAPGRWGERDLVAFGEPGVLTAQTWLPATLAPEGTEARFGAAGAAGVPIIRRAPAKAGEDGAVHEAVFGLAAPEAIDGRR